MTIVTVKDGHFIFSSPLSRLRFMQQAEGKEVHLNIHEQVTDGMRKYFEGCLVPAFFYLHPQSGWETFADAREVLKLEFSPGTREVADRDGNWVKVTPSTADLGKRRFTAFVEAITDWMRENGVPEEVIDSQEYIRWRDTNFSELIYPPLRRLKEIYDASKSHRE